MSLVENVFAMKFIVVYIILLIAQWLKELTNENVSYVNTPLDGRTYPRWKMFHFVQTKMFLKNARTQQANIRDQQRHLAMTQPH